MMNTKITFLGTCACDFSPRLKTDCRDRFDNDAYRHMKPELYFAAAYNRACRVAALINKYEGEDK